MKIVLYHFNGRILHGEYKFRISQDRSNTLFSVSSNPLYVYQHTIEVEYKKGRCSTIHFRAEVKEDKLVLTSGGFTKRPIELSLLKDFPGMPINVRLTGNTGLYATVTSYGNLHPASTRVLYSKTKQP